MKRASRRRFLRKAGLLLGGAVSWARQPGVSTSSPVPSTPPRDATWTVVPHSNYDPPSNRDALAPPEKAAVLVLLNGKVTVDPAASNAQSVAIKDGLIQAVDTDDAIRALAGAVTRIMDLACESVTPGWGSAGAVQR